MRTDHEIFNTPHSVQLTFEEQPPSNSYLYRASGKKLGETMPMWRVQTEGYKDGKGMLTGLVSSPSLASSPDGEFISSGLNSKGCDAVAIGRQGNYLQWGFAASPTYMTEEAKLVFINAIHYIKKFDGQQAFVNKVRYVKTRKSIDEMMYMLSDDGYAAVKRYFASASRPEPERQWAIRHGIPDSIKEKFGENWDQYATYYKENRPYLHYDVPEGEWLGKIFVDQDAKQIGIANDDLKLLDRCVDLLELQEDSEMALRLLKRYTNEQFDSPDQWKTWLSENREFLVFSEVSGFKFLVDPNKSDHAAKDASSEKSDAKTEATSQAETEAPDADDPVKISCRLVQLKPDSRSSSEKRFKVVLDVKILDGWHIYSFVPKGEPYKVTTLKIKTDEGVEKVGDVVWPEGLGYAAAPKVKVWENEVTLTQEVRLTDKSDQNSVELTFAYQACDEYMCHVPTEKTLTLEVK